jgi:hypothetical protein
MGLCGWVQEAPVNGSAISEASGANGVHGANRPQSPVKTTAGVFFHATNGHAPIPAPAPLSSVHLDLHHTVTGDPQPPTRPGTPTLSAPSAPPPPIQWDTVDLVERVVRVVRWRRSIKAIETYEQVRFLVEFVEFLRGRCVPTPEIGTTDASVVTNGYTNGLPDGITDHGLVPDRDFHLVMMKERDQEVQGTA